MMPFDIRKPDSLLTLMWSRTLTSCQTSCRCQSCCRTTPTRPASPCQRSRWPNYCAALQHSAALKAG